MVIACGMDLGTNSFRLLIAEVENRRIVPLVSDLVTVRLGQGLGKSGILSPAAMARGRTALERFAVLLAEHPPERVRICGTHALRQARNRQAFQEMTLAILGHPLAVISGEEEAGLSLRGVLSALGETVRYPLLLADVGGGSSELIWQPDAYAVPRIWSLPVGAVGLTEQFGDDHSAMEKSLQAQLAEVFRDFPRDNRGGSLLHLVGLGGTATSLAGLSLGLDAYDAALVQNHTLDRQELDELCARLVTLSPTERNALIGLGSGRGEIILAGAMIFRELLRQLGIGRLLVSDAGLLEGILLNSFDPAAIE